MVPSRERAQSLILAGRIRLGDLTIDKPGKLVDESVELTLLEDSNPYVSRGGLKLEHALRAFQIDPSNKIILDIGASTGGFTDCLLQHGGKKVYSVDVGYGQLDWKIQSDSRVVVLDRKNARYLVSEDINRDSIDLAVIDVSFISLKLILPSVFKLLHPNSDLIGLVKPQFEVGKGEVENKGVILSRSKHRKVLMDIYKFIEFSDWIVSGWTSSPIKGQKGNVEYLIHAKQKGYGKPVFLETVEEVLNL